MLKFLQAKGLTPTGDEPNYLVVAYAIGRFHTLEVGHAYHYAFAHSLFIHWPRPFHPQTALSHGRVFGGHEPGLPILLALPLAIGGVTGAYGALIFLTSVLTVYLSHLVGRLSSSSSPWVIAIGGLFLVPASLLATTQIYPDLLSGLIIAIVVFSIATIEAHDEVTLVQAVLCGVLIGFLPWLHAQNFLFAALLGVAFVAVSVRRRLSIRWFVITLGLAAILWTLIAVYNLYVYGRLTPAGAFSWGAPGWTRILTLLADRQQGLFIQFPVVILGLVAMWRVRSRVPVAASVTALVSVTAIVVSGTFSNSWEGSSFVGRFNWTVYPVLLAFAGLYLIDAWRERRQFAVRLTCLVAALSVLQLAFLLEGSHTYYSMVWVTPNTPPAGPGWWGPLDTYLPSFAQLVPAWNSARVVWGVILLAVLVVLAFYFLLVKSGTRRSRRIPAAILASGTLIAVLGTGFSGAQPIVPMETTASQLGARVGTVVGTTRSVVGGPSGYLTYGPYWLVPAGSYEATIAYSLNDTKRDAAIAEVAVDHVSAAGTPSNPFRSQLLERRRLVAESRGRETLHFATPFRGLLEVRVYWQGSGSLTVGSIHLASGPSG